MNLVLLVTVFGTVTSIQPLDYLTNNIQLLDKHQTNEIIEKDVIHQNGKSSDYFDRKEPEILTNSLILSALNLNKKQLLPAKLKHPRKYNYKRKIFQKWRKIREMRMSLEKVHKKDEKLGCDSGFCLSTNEACIVTIPGGSEVTLFESFNQTYNTIGCSERCEQNAACTSWTWFAGGKVCQIYSDCKSKVRGCIDCQSGPRSCGLWQSTDVILSGGLGGYKPGYPALDNATIIGDNGTVASNMVMPRHRWGHISAFIGYTLYICGGSTEQAGNIAPNDTCDIFDASSRYGAWVMGPTLREPRHAAAAVELFGRIYVFGGIGFDGSYLDTSEVLEPNGNIWEESSNLPYGGIAGLCAVPVQDGIFIAGGQYQNSRVSNSASIYNLTTSRWYDLPPMKYPRAYHGCATLRKTTDGGSDHLIVVTGGIGYSDPLNLEEPIIELSSVESFCTKTWTWGPGVPLPQARAFHSMINNQDRVRIYGGTVGENIDDQILELVDSVEWVPLKYRLPEPSRSSSISRYPTKLIKNPQSQI